MCFGSAPKYDPPQQQPIVINNTPAEAPPAPPPSPPPPAPAQAAPSPAAPTSPAAAGDPGAGKPQDGTAQNQILRKKKLGTSALKIDLGVGGTPTNSGLNIPS